MFFSLRYIKSPLLVFITLGVLIFACHGLSLKAQFMIDDFSYAYPNQKLSIYKNITDFFGKSVDHHYSPFDLLINISLFRAFPAPGPLYAVNLALFWVNCLFLFFLVQKISGDSQLGYLTAVFFSCHPVNAEILSHIASINTVLISAGLLMISLILFWDYLHLSPRRASRLCFSLVSFTAAVLCIETAVILPVYLLSFIFFSKKTARSDLLKSILPFVLTSIVYFFVWVKMAGGESHWTEKIAHLNITFPVYMAGLGSLSKWYIQNLFYPKNFVLIKNIAPSNHFVWAWNAGFLAVAAFFVIFYRACRDHRKLFALTWFSAGFLFILPAGLIHAYSMGLVLEPHWFYFSSMGFFTFLAILALDLKKHIRSVIYSALILTLTMTWGVLSYRHHVMAKTEIGYLEYWLKNNPQNLLAAIKLGYQYGYLKSLSVNLDLIDEMDNQVENFIIMKDFKAAQALAGKLLISDPLNPRKKEWLIRLMALNLKTHVISEAQLREYVSVNADKRDLLWLIKELDRLELGKTALGITAKGLELFHGDPDFIYIQAAILANENRFDEALDLLKTRPDLLKNQTRFEKLSRDIDAARAQGEKKRIPPQK